MKNSVSNGNRFLGLIRWSLIRHKFYIPIFILAQVLLSFAVIYGFLFITAASDEYSKTYLCTGAITINIIAVTCVLAPQIVNEAKQNGVYEYQKTLPIARVGILLSDLFIWGILCLPGIITSVGIGKLGFDFAISLSFLSIITILLIVFSLLSLGFAISYVFPSNVVSLLTQLIMIGGLLFSPIIYSAERLPAWTSVIYNNLPFVPASNLIRSSLFNLEHLNFYHYVVVLLWGIISFFISLNILARRK